MRRRRFIFSGLALAITLPFASAAGTAPSESAFVDQDVIAFAEFEAEFASGVETIRKRTEEVGNSPVSADQARVHGEGREDFEAWAHG